MRKQIRLWAELLTILPFSALTLLIGRQEGPLADLPPPPWIRQWERHPASKKKYGVISLVVMISMELCKYIYSSGCHHHFHHPSFNRCKEMPRGCYNTPIKRLVCNGDILVPTNPSPPEKMAVKPYCWHNVVVSKCKRCERQTENDMRRGVYSI